MHLQCCTPTLYVMGVATRTYKRDDHYPICTRLHYGCLLALCGPTTHVATLCGGSFPDIFFLLSVSVTGCLKKKKRKTTIKFPLSNPHKHIKTVTQKPYQLKSQSLQHHCMQSPRPWVSSLPAFWLSPPLTSHRTSDSSFGYKSIDQKKTKKKHHQESPLQST